jgi:hypothetical protein
MKSLALILSLVSSLAFAANTYYPTELSSKIEKHLIKDDALKGELYRAIIVSHKAVGYSPAKKFLFGQLHLKQDSRGYFVEDVYCKKEFTNGAGPGNIPDQNQINCEHTWPQSKFTGSFPNETQKSDLHHLYPTDSKANSTRGNFNFADVVANENLGADCKTSKSGASTTTGGKNFFEPPTDHKGNVARALFYFSVRYNININDSEEEFLKRWDQLDPIDQDEIDRNNQIQKIQGNRNPFIDFPGLAQDIKNF